ncbi:helix-turn-helix transcriptional regulator [Eggerthella sinensis]|uniref:helix-turn-helix transcriptional regulator n=1 Tax=Eggerthella sinensis TaxID=242230 RepID=UPI00266D278A|nr:helix-turn-helix transcriptional regulator [Eggerthella sinensis]
MASFRDNLQHLRATRNMSQSQLAMLVGVSRQSVAKWEAETSYPEMDKLIKIVDIFDCTIDELVRGDLTSLANDPSRSVPECAPTDIFGYDEHMCKRAWRVPIGFGLIVLGFGAGNLIEAFELAAGSQPVALGFVTFLIGIVAGLALLVPARMEHRSFMLRHPYIEDFYTQTQKESARMLEAWGIVAGIALLLSSMVVPMIVSFAGMGQSLASFAWWACIAAGVVVVVRSALFGKRTEIARYNKKNRKEAVSDGEAPDDEGRSSGHDEKAVRND